MRERTRMRNNEGLDAEDQPRSLTGVEVLNRVLETQDSYEALTIQMLHTGQLGVRAPDVFENIGTGLLLLTEAGSCAWGCRGGDHIIENLVRRYCNYAFGAIRLACLGLYDEAIALVRSLAEIGNLFQLFYLDDTRLISWRQADSKRKLKDFSPIKVRFAIEQLGHNPTTDKDTYSRLCEIGVHVSPTSAYLSHDIDRRVYFGGNYSILGFLLALNETAHAIAPILALVGTLVEAPDHKMQELRKAERGLTESASWLNVNNYEQFFDAQRSKYVTESVLQELDQMDEVAFQTMSQTVIEAMTSRGDLPEDLSSLPEEEFEEKVFTEIVGRLSQQALEKARAEEAHWLRQSAEAALVTDTLAKAARYRECQTNQSEDEGA